MATVEKAMVFFLTFAAVMAVSMGKMYKVGDSEGWTIGNVSYASWAASKTFHVGDTIGIQSTLLSSIYLTLC